VSELADTLIQRYTYGNFAEVPSFSGESDFFLGIPARQREMISLARVQILEQREAASEIARSNMAAADVICSELNSQTERLEAALERNSDATVLAIEDLADRISGELGEIRWELAQLRSVADQILQVLKKPRSTEAMELLRQGIRNLVNDKLEQAEERFNLALRLDNTDYQVLMNLSSVKLRQGNAPRAIEFASDALTLPEDLDPQARADALWHLSRIYYSMPDYSRALEHGHQSASLLPIPRRLLQVGIYAILTGNRAEGVKIIEEAIRQDPRLFAVTASASDLREHRSAILPLLASLSSEALAEAQARSRELAAKVERAGDLSAVHSRTLQRFRGRYKNLVNVLSDGSYSKWREASDGLLALQPLPDLLKGLHQTNVELTEKQKKEGVAAQQLADAELAVKKIPGALGCVPWIAPFLASFIASGIGIKIAQENPGLYWPGIILINVAFWGTLVASLIWVGRFERRRTSRVETAKAHLQGCKAAVAEARSKLDRVRQSVADSLTKAGC
jgi:tetratricopeptide (TPR) repeat protein